MKILSVGTELFHADGRTDRCMKKLTFTSRNFANAPTNELSKHNLNVTRA